MSVRGEKTFKYYNENPVAPIDDWTEANFGGLAEQIETHIAETTDVGLTEDIYNIRRLFFISLRQFLEENSI